MQDDDDKIFGPWPDFEWCGRFQGRLFVRAVLVCLMLIGMGHTLKTKYALVFLTLFAITTDIHYSCMLAASGKSANDKRKPFGNYKLSSRTICYVPQTTTPTTKIQDISHKNGNEHVHPMPDFRHETEGERERSRWVDEGVGVGIGNGNTYVSQNNFIHAMHWRSLFANRGFRAGGAGEQCNATPHCT